MDYKKIYKKIEKRYIVLSIFLILIFISRQILVQRQIELGKDMSRVINISGRQRMLSQKITKNVLLIYENPNKDNIEFYLEDLQRDLYIFERSHFNLINGNESQGISGKNSDIVIDLFEDIDPYFISLVDTTKEILNLVKAGENDSDLILENIRTLILNERSFLERMDEIVFEYDNESKESITNLEILENIVFYIILLALLLITLFILLPAGKTLRHAFIDINEGNENIKKLFYSMNGSLFLVNKKGDILSKNENAKEIMLNQDKNNINFCVNWFNVNILDIINRVIEGEMFNSIEVKVEGRDEKNISLLLSAIKGSYKNEEVVLLSAYDITAQKKAEEILRDLAIKDELTGLYNRHFLESIIKAEIERAKRYDYLLSAAIMDIDDFKKINDKWGHPIGDDVLREAARILKENSRESDYVIRIGGEEFVVLMPHTNLEGAYILADKLRQAIEKNIHKEVGYFTSSFGVAERKVDETYFEMYNRMDDALYRAKKEGKNIVLKSGEESVLGMKSFLEWSDKWNCGEKTIDDQHEELITEIGKFINGTIDLEDSENTIYTLNKLLNLIERHFKYEEKVQREIGYKEVNAHTRIHTELLKKSYRLKELFIEGEIDFKDLLEFMLHDVITGHLLKEDTKFFSYLE